MRSKLQGYALKNLGVLGRERGQSSQVLQGTWALMPGVSTRLKNLPSRLGEFFDFQSENHHKTKGAMSSREKVILGHPFLNPL